MKRFLAIALITLAGAGTLRSQAVWKVDPTHSRVDFAVTHLVIFKVKGRFTDFDVVLKQGKDDFSSSTVQATIKSKSVNTDNDRRDTHLRSDDFLNAEKFPNIVFKSTSLRKDGRQHLQG